jgi:uncharacterized protein YigA (DUF484 family)
MSGTYRAVQIARIATDLVASQLEIAGVARTTVLEDAWALGYFYGVHHAALELDRGSDEQDRLLGLVSSLERQFGDRQVALIILRHSEQLQGDEDFVAGHGRATIDYMRFIGQEAEPALGLYEHVLQGRADTPLPLMDPLLDFA